jgi:23S rRNA-/tRNA-specific pseudouridylate synthase
LQVTTGTLLLARSLAQVRTLHTQFRTREVEKTYLALVRGGERSFPGRSGQLKDVFRYGRDGRFERALPLGRKEKKMIESDNRGVVGLAETHWELLGTSVSFPRALSFPLQVFWLICIVKPKAPLSLVKLSLISGMKHQLRIHMSKVLRGACLPVRNRNHGLTVRSIAPILGDLLYSSSPITSSITHVTKVPEGMYLHASHISFFVSHVYISPSLPRVDLMYTWRDRNTGKCTRINGLG